MRRELPSHPASLWHDRAFVLFVAARMISITGTTLTLVVLPILVFQLTGSALRTSLLASLHVLPYLIFGLFAGVLADRLDRRRLMIVCNLVCDHNVMFYIKKVDEEHFSAIQIFQDLRKKGKQSRNTRHIPGLFSLFA